VVCVPTIWKKTHRAGWEKKGSGHAALLVEKRHMSPEGDVRLERRVSTLPIWGKRPPYTGTNSGEAVKPFLARKRKVLRKSEQPGGSNPLKRKRCTVWGTCPANSLPTQGGIKIRVERTSGKKCAATRKIDRNLAVSRKNSRPREGENWRSDCREKVGRVVGKTFEKRKIAPYS